MWSPSRGARVRLYAFGFHSCEMAITWLDCNCRTLSIYAKRGDETRPEERERESRKGRRKGLVSAGRRETVQSAIEPFALAFASVSRYVFHGSIMIDSCDSWFMAWLPEIPSTSQTLFIWIMIRGITISLETEPRTCYVACNWHADVTGTSAKPDVCSTCSRDFIFINGAKRDEMNDRDVYSRSIIDTSRGQVITWDRCSRASNLDRLARTLSEPIIGVVSDRTCKRIPLGNCRLSRN